MRLFVAIDMPLHIKDALSELETPQIPGAKWVNRDHMHLTLRFIGETDPDMCQIYQTSLESIKHPVFTLELSSVGRFPPSPQKAPRVLWAGVAKNPALEHLAGAISSTLERAGLGPPAHPFNPHITLARLRTHLPAAEAKSFLKAHAHFALEPFPVTYFALYESQLTPQGPHYTRLARYPLG